MAMKITIVTGPFQPTPPAPCGAVERLWVDLAEEMAAAGHQVTLISREHEDLAKEQVVNGVKHFRFGKVTRTRHIWVDLLKDLYHSARQIPHLPDADVIVTNAFWLPVLLSILPSSRRGKIHVGVNRFPKRQMWLYGRCARLCAVSTAIKDSILEQFPRGEPMVTMISNPVNTKVFTPPQTPRRQSDERTILYTGRIHPEKGVHILIEAFRELSPQYPRLKLRLLGQQRVDQGGGGPEFVNKLKAKTEGLPIEFCEPIFDTAALAAELQRADYYCYPSVSYRGEACPVAPLEAMATGLSPIVSDLPQFLDYIKEGETGFIFDRNGEEAPARLAARLKQQLDDDELTDRMGAAALEMSKNFSNQAIAERYLHDFELLTPDVPFELKHIIQQPLHDRLRIKYQRSRFTSSWSLWSRIKGVLWSLIYLLLFRLSPKQLLGWRLFLLKVFGCQVNGKPYVAPSAKIKFPWLLRLDDRSCIGPSAEVYNLGPVWLKERCVVTQYVYLCAGTHDLRNPELPLVVGPIIIGREAFIGAKSLILPGVIVGDGAVLGAGSVLAKDADPWTIYAGNPAKRIRERVFDGPREVEDSPDTRRKWVPQS